MNTDTFRRLKPNGLRLVRICEFRGAPTIGLNGFSYSFDAKANGL